MGDERRRDDTKAYHHGDLPSALLDAVDAIIRERGVAAVSLREAARRAGVSHAAPAHHFGDKAGLLTAYATQGFALLHERLDAAAAGAPGGPALLACGLAYVGFAVDERGRFTVMFRPEVVHADRPDFRAARDGAFGVLVDAVRELRRDLDADDVELLRSATGAWSIVHGFSTLWLDGNLDHRITTAPPADAAVAALAAFQTTLFLAAGADPSAPGR